MSLTYKVGPSEPVYLPHVEYLGGEAIAGNGASQACTLETGTQIVLISAEGGGVQFQLNAESCPASGAGFVPQDGQVILGPFTNLTSLHVYMASGTTAHLTYYREREVSG